MISELWMDLNKDQDPVPTVRIGLFSDTASAFMANMLDHIAKDSDSRHVEVITN